MLTIEKMDDLKRRFVEARCDEARDAISREIAQLADADPATVADIVLAQIEDTNRRAEETLLRNRLKEVVPAISLAYVAKNYFKKSRSWLIQRINGNRVNGVPAKFTGEELATLEYALKDIASNLSKIRFS